MMCPCCGTEMEKHQEAYKRHHEWEEREFFDFYICPKCGADTRTKEEMY